MSEAKEAILERIRSRLGPAQPPEDPEGSSPEPTGPAEVSADVEKTTPGDQDLWQVGREDGPATPVGTRQLIIEQFIEFAAEYKANVVRTASPELQGVLLDLLAARDSQRVVIPPDLPFASLIEEVAPVPDSGFDGRALDRFHASVTCCALGIAETGTIVLDAGPGQGRRAITLVPDHHVCVIFEDQIVDSVNEAVAILEKSVCEGRPLTFISGPSATSDIELTRVEGVHGARNLDIVVTQRVKAVTIG